jgi:hypothetical protein
MACRITNLAIDSHDPELLAEFWCGVLGYHLVGRDGADVSISGDGADEPRYAIDFLQSDEAKTQKLRLHLDVRATDRDQGSELQRLLALGARQVDIGQGEVSWHVLADPEGNEFCLLRAQAQP